MPQDGPLAALGRAARPSLVFSLVLGALAPAYGQTAREPGPAPAQHQHEHGAGTSALFPEREISGTSWAPDTTPMVGAMARWRGWEVMAHGNAFAYFFYEPGDRHRTGGFSTHQFGSTNWGMGMARRRVGEGRIGLRAMLSLEPWTVPGCGYLSLLATGEMCEGDTIHDRQHPHDLFMELAADYDRPLRGSLRWQVYGGLAGEPALGPPGFPHRLSAMFNPIGPIGHHSMDSTHITYGLVTAGVYDRRWKVEGSLFNGREPDENRADLDLAALDSFSGRLTFLPGDRLALQVSAGHLAEAEAAFPPQPRASIDRVTASATYHRELAAQGFWATTLAYGFNTSLEVEALEEFRASTHALMLETSATLRGRHTWFGRAEVVDKPAHDLHAHEYPASIFTVAKIQVGYVRHFPARFGLTPGLGATASLSLVPAELESRYGGRAAPGFGVFLNVSPRR
jgi:hypothetical protein